MARHIDQLKTNNLQKAKFSSREMTLIKLEMVIFIFAKVSKFGDFICH